MIDKHDQKMALWEIKRFARKIKELNEEAENHQKIYTNQIGDTREEPGVLIDSIGCLKESLDELELKLQDEVDEQDEYFGKEEK
jgi:hypothetical protein